MSTDEVWAMVERVSARLPQWVRDDIFADCTRTLHPYGPMNETSQRERLAAEVWQAVNDVDAVLRRIETKERGHQERSREDLARAVSTLLGVHSELRALAGQAAPRDTEDTATALSGEGS